MRPTTKERNSSFLNSPQVSRKPDQSSKNLSYSRSVESLGSRKLYFQQEVLKVSTTSSKAPSLNKSMDAVSNYGPKIEESKMALIAESLRLGLEETEVARDLENADEAAVETFVW